MPVDKQISIEEAITRYCGTLENPDGSSDITGPCGDRMAFYFKLAHGRISEIRFKATGCGVTLACGAAVAFTADALPLSEALRISPAYIVDVIGQMPPDHKHCPILAATSFYRAIADYFFKTEQTPEETSNAAKE
ncbi:MAG: iron-sulfur cluster assembly scaffold protein [Elusimicrobiaceae bacterium]|nr:iron-sulfur cluster assembly scaffold protein [Elusimicrobiaceae bacterium]